MCVRPYYTSPLPTHTHSVDATKDNGRMGRLVNHSRKQANVITKIHIIDNNPVLYFLASQTIHANDELLYDYGERNREIISYHKRLKS